MSPSFKSLDELERYLKTTPLEQLLDECRQRGITQTRLASMFRLPPNFLNVVKSSERKGHTVSRFRKTYKLLTDSVREPEFWKIPASRACRFKLGAID